MTPSHDPDERELAAARRRMVDEQLVARGIRDRRVLDAMATVPRHVFVSEAQRDAAYDDRALPTLHGQTLSQPWVVARMLELAALQPHQRVLEVGAGSGYQAALLARLVAQVVSVERVADLVELARTTLAALGVTGVEVVLGDGSLGWQGRAPYARVLAAAAAPHVPNALLEQLDDGGRLVIPVGSARAQRLEVWQRSGDRWSCERHGDVRFVPLIGHDAWREDPSTTE